MNESEIIAVCSQQESFLEQAHLLAQQLSLPLLDSYPETSTHKFLLVVTQNPSGYQLELHFPNEKLNPLLVDFHSQRLLYRQKFGGGRQQAIAKAVGLKRGKSPNVLDATAGLGKDAFILASLKCQVTMIERNPIIHALLSDGMRRLKLNEKVSDQIESRLLLHLQDSLNYLKNNADTPDVIYLDPMYPHRSKSALVKKEMRRLRNLVGDDTDFDSLLETALLTAKDRVVIKRPKTAPPIGTIPPSHSIESKKTRFDVYFTRSDA